MGRIWFWSDTHFNHARVIEYSSRPDADVEQMNLRLIEAWSRVVVERDDIYFLGDFAFGDRPMKTADIFGMLPGHKHLILGNHDEKNKSVLRLKWASVDRLKEVRYEGRKFVLCHYPIESWASKHHGAIHLHGHSHGTLQHKLPRRFDVGCDVFPYPISAEEIVAMADKELLEADHRDRAPEPSDP